MWWSFRLRPFDWRLTGRRSSFRPHSLETARKLWVASRGCPSSYTTMRHTVLTLPVNSQEKNAISAEEEWIQTSRAEARRFHPAAKAAFTGGRAYGTTQVVP